MTTISDSASNKASGEDLQPQRRSWSLSNAAFGRLLVLPALAILLAVYIYPLLYSAYMSLHNFYLPRPQDFEFVGLGNYMEILGSQEFQRALRNTVIYAGLAVPLEFVFGLALALALANIEQGRGVIRMLLTLPMMLAPVVMGLMWKFMYNDQLGVINYLIRAVGLTDRPPLWLADPNLALYSIILVDIWATTPLLIILLLAGLLAIPHEFYEAAQIDGAGFLYRFRRITLPLLRPVIMVALLLRGMDAFRVFDVVYIMTKGGPALRSDVLSFFAYRTAFTELSMGRATATAWIMTGILIVFAIVLIRTLRGQGEAT
ncbi:MAG: sugar ABC transporter permease [Caldilineaceae bacterium]|nr:sugar ABC transporter permease [Caldilineaceae bacterium]